MNFFYNFEPKFRRLISMFYNDIYILIAYEWMVKKQAIQPS